MKKLSRFLIGTLVAFTLLACPVSTFPQVWAQAINDSPFAHQMKGCMEMMDKDMMSVTMTGDPDHDFSTMMIPHHQGAVDMAKAVLVHGNDPVIRRLAQEIIVTQLQEIEALRLRLAAIDVGTARVSGPGRSDVICGKLPSSRDRVYTADQTSGTISVIDPTSNKLLRVIRLGDPVPGSLSPLYPIKNTRFGWWNPALLPSG